MNQYKHSLRAFIQFYGMICAFALKAFIENQLNQIKQIDFSLDALGFILRVIDSVVLLLVIIRFFHGNVVFINKCHDDTKKIVPKHMYIDLSFMLFQSVILVLIPLFDINNVHLVVMILIFTDAIWMLLVWTIKNRSCEEVKPYAERWMISNLFFAFILFGISVIPQEYEIIKNVMNIILIFINTIINFYMNNKFLNTKENCEKE